MLIGLLLCVGCGTGETAEPNATIAEMDPLADRGEVELVDDGYGWSEGPQWMSEAGVLLFTDANADAIYQVGLATRSRSSGSRAASPTGSLSTVKGGCSPRSSVRIRSLVPRATGR